MLGTTEKTNESYASRSINQQRLDAILEYAGSSILDVGCGNGAYVLKLRETHNINGVDYQRFPTWNEAPSLFHVSDASKLNLPDNSVDTITCFEALEHLKNPEETLREFRRVCKKNVILTVPNCDLTKGMKNSKLLYWHWIDRTHLNFYDSESIQELVSESGLKVCHSYYINKINVFPFIEESFDLSGFWGGFVRKYLLKKQICSYHLTCLVVAEKE